MLGIASHGNWVFFSALVPLALLALGFGVPRARAPLAGLAVGVAAHLAFYAVVPMASGLSFAWLAANAVACLVLARLALRR